jgi:predicted nucleic acid-binding protein
MGFLIDTNILSELQKGERADNGVKTWYASCKPDDLYLSVLVVGEIRQGIERLRRGRTRPTRAALVGRVLPAVL